MSQLEQELIVLRRLFEPWNTAPHGTVIWEPDESDQNAEFKRNLISKASEVIVAGENALACNSFEVPQFGEPEFNAIAELLANDHAQQDFYELAVACHRVVKSLVRIAA